MRSEATLKRQSSDAVVVLYMALELADKTWKILFASSLSGRRRERSVPARQLGQLMAEIALAKRTLGLPEDAKVMSCYEAGRDGFWLHRALIAAGVANLVVDSSSIEVPQRARRRKTDRIDLVKLMGLLLRYCAGERTVWSVVRVPDPAAEDLRRLSRAIERLKRERVEHRTRIASLLVLEGLKLQRIGGPDWAQRVEALRRWDGVPLGRMQRRELVLEGERLALVERQLAELKAEREDVVARAQEPAAATARRLAQLRGIATESSFVFATETLGWRRFANRRELAGSVGLTGTPWLSGDMAREQGLSKTGNRRMRTMLVEIAWGWLKYQPDSTLTRWWRARYGAGSGRARKSGIVALARRLLVALWHYIEHGVVPEGAELKKVAA